MKSRKVLGTDISSKNMTNCDDSLDEPRELASHSVEWLQFTRSTGLRDHSTSHEDAFKCSFGTTNLQQEDEYRIVHLESMWVEDVCQGERGGVF